MNFRPLKIKKNMNEMATYKLINRILTEMINLYILSYAQWSIFVIMTMK